MRYFAILCCLVLTGVLTAQDTITIQTLTYDSTGRDYVFSFPDNPGETYSKIVMEYNMRCRGARVSTGADRNLGCGEWDYSCNTFIVDPTRTDSLAATHPSHIIPGFLGNTFNYLERPTRTFTQYEQYLTSGVAGANVKVATLPADVAAPIALTGESSARRLQYIYTAAELTALGLVSGPVMALDLDVDGAGGTVDFMRVRMGHTSQESYIGDNLVDDLMDVYFSNTSLGSGSNTLYLHTPFDWNGTDNIVVDLSYTDEDAGHILATQSSASGSTGGLINTADNRYLELRGGQYIVVDPASVDDITSEITIEFWTFGDASVLPRSNSVLEGLDANNQRSVNIHLPWGDGIVYWDCGSDGGYDRIQKQASPADFEGRWTHWAFTKNAATGSMKIYLDGALWHSATDRNRPMSIKEMNIGANAFGGNAYPGSLDEVRIWNKELAADVIKSYAARSVDDRHTNADALQLYYQLDDDGATVTDLARGLDGTIDGTPIYSTHRGKDLFTNFEAIDTRLQLAFRQGDYTIDSSPTAVIDTADNLPQIVSSYSVQGTDLQLDDVRQLWQANSEQLIDEAGNRLDTYPVTADGSLMIEDLSYFRKLPARYEIMSFVTPYGIGIDFGPEGHTWSFDMTDFAPILKGDKRMFLGKGGEFQEEMDIKFHFIKGTPARDVLDIQQIWRPGDHCNFGNIDDDNCFEPRIVTPRSDAFYYKIRTMITGHGQQGEFIPRTHHLSINGFREFSWQAWKECADNPIYPQGGTWIYDRAGWCPGMATDLYEWDLEDLVFPGEPFELDYSMSDATGDSRYLINHQLVSYGDYNMDYDVGMVEIINPTNAIEYARDNPTCQDPVIVIQNLGGETVNEVVIEYTAGGSIERHTYTGRLSPLEEQEVTLPIDYLAFYSGVPAGEAHFTARIVSIDGATDLDEQDNNQSLTAAFEMPDMYDDSDYIIQLNTNNRASQNRLTVEDRAGTVLLERRSLANTTAYRDTLSLERGCYTMEVTDSGQNGLSFWALPDEGNGSVRLRSRSQTLRTFDPDFGARLTYSFMVGNTTNTDDPADATIVEVQPNPTTGLVTVHLPADQVAEQMDIWVTDAMGKTMLMESQAVTGDASITIDLGDMPSGLYILRLSDGEHAAYVAKLIKTR